MIYLETISIGILIKFFIIIGVYLLGKYIYQRINSI